MTKNQFNARAIRAAERAIQVPAGWWGVWRDVTNGTVRVTFAGGGWRLSRGGKTISRHDSRKGAIRKADGIR